MMDDDMDNITKEWSEKFLVPVIDEKLSDIDTI